MKPLPRLIGVAAILALAGSVACGGGSTNGNTATGCSGSSAQTGHTTVTAWYHGSLTVQPGLTMAKLADDFNKSQSNVTVNFVAQAEATYSTTVKAAAASGGLPDLLDFDGPNLYNYAWSKDLIPMDNCLSSGVKADLTPANVQQGTYAGKLYGVGYYEGSQGVFVRRSVLQKNGIRIPAGPQDAWTAAEFTSALQTLQKAGFAHPLDMKINYGIGEWYTWGFSPILQSAGADLINRSNYQTATGTLNSDAAVKALTTVQSWFKAGYVDPNDDDASFLKGRTPISWVGPWVYDPYAQAAGNDLAIVPLPNFGNGSKAGNGSWQWGITKQAKNPAAVAAFINYMLSPDHALIWANAGEQGYPVKSVASESTLYGPSGPLNLITQVLDGGFTVTRPQTPAYPTITDQFARAFKAIADGGDVKTALTAAATAIDQDIKDNSGYPAPGT